MIHENDDFIGGYIRLIQVIKARGIFLRKPVHYDAGAHGISLCLSGEYLRDGATRPNAVSHCRIVRRVVFFFPHSGSIDVADQ